MKPFGIVALYPRRSIGQIAVREAALLLGCKGRGAKPLPAAEAGDLLNRNVPAISKRSQRDGARRIGAHQIRERLLPPQAVEDEIADPGAVARACEAVRFAPIGERDGSGAARAP